MSSITAVRNFRAHIFKKEGLPFSGKGAFRVATQKKVNYATPRIAAAGAGVATACSALSDSAMVRLATGFSQNRAKNAASRSMALGFRWCPLKPKAESAR